ncbi:hypothetical protein D3C75_325880 [compost metagenome]
MKEIPPLLARAIAILWSETACMTAEVTGRFIVSAGVSPRLNLVTGVRRSTLPGMHCLVVRLGTSRNSLNVLDGCS